VWSLQLWMMQVDGSNPHQVGLGASPAFSPDGTAIVFLSGEYGRDISIMNCNGTGRRVVYSSDTYKSSPTFCLGGSHVLFLEEPNANGTSYISLIPFDGGKPQRIAKTD
jgi:Tol biopolymer transport system component